MVVAYQRVSDRLMPIPFRTPNAQLQEWLSSRGGDPSPRRALVASPPSRDSGETNWESVRAATHPRDTQDEMANCPGAADEAPIKDKAFRKYASGVDRALALFETALQEWADYISFLNRLLKVSIYRVRVSLHREC